MQQLLRYSTSLVSLSPCVVRAATVVQGDCGVKQVLSFRASFEGQWMGNVVLFLKGL